METRKILVTGGCGFIGTEIVKQLLAKGHDVLVADNLSKPESAVKEGYAFKQVDLTFQDKAEEVMKGNELCIHLAAKIGGIGYFHKYPAWILSENNKLYSSVFDAAVKEKLGRLVFISSSMVFESATVFPSKEEYIKSTPPPMSAYGFSKLVGEYYCQAYWDEHQLPFTICRPFNAYGINEHPGEFIGYAHVIPDLVKKMLGGQYPLELLGDGQQSRCYTHVRDLADGIITATLSEKAKNQDFNISSPTEINVLDLAKKLWQLCGRTEEFRAKFVPGFKYDVRRRIPDTTKIKELLGWQARIPFEEGLKEVVAWLRQRLEK